MATQEIRYSPLTQLQIAADRDSKGTCGDSDTTADSDSQSTAPSSPVNLRDEESESPSNSNLDNGEPEEKTEVDAYLSKYRAHIESEERKITVQERVERVTESKLKLGKLG